MAPHHAPASEPPLSHEPESEPPESQEPESEPPESHEPESELLLHVSEPLFHELDELLDEP